MREKFEAIGEWWLPEKPDTKIAGTFSFDPVTGAELLLIGSFQTQLEMLQALGTWGVTHEFPVIFGTTLDGIQFMLCECTQIPVKLNLSSAKYPSKFRPHVVLEGLHGDSVEKTLLTSFTVEISQLQNWYGKSGKKIQPSNLNELRTTITYEKPQPAQVRVNDASIILGHDASIDYPSFGRDFILKERAVVSVEPSTPVYLSGLFPEWLGPLVGLFTLLMDTYVQICGLRVCIQLQNTAAQSSGSAEVYWRTSRYDESTREILPHQMLCPYSFLEIEWEDVLQEWFKCYYKLRPVVDLFISQVATPRSFSSNTFLNSSQVAEAYHLSRRNNLVEPRSEFKHKKSEIYSLLPRQLKKWLKGRFKYANVKSLRMRLEDLLLERLDLFQLTVEEAKSLAENIAKIRNYYTHYSRASAPVGHDDLYMLSELMRWVMTACLLEEIGLERNRAHCIIGRCQKFLYFREVHLKKRTVTVINVEEHEPQEKEETPR